MILVFWLDFVTWWCVGWKTKILVLENFLDSILTSALKVMWEKFGSKRNWYWHDWCIAKFHDFCVWAWFCDLVVYVVKNENLNFGKLAEIKPHKCLQSNVGEVWEQKELILTWLVHGQVPWFWCFGFILWLGGVWDEKRKSWFWKTGWAQSSQMPPKWCGRSLGAKGIDLDIVGAWPSSMIFVFWLDFVTWWCVGWKTKILILENLLE